MSGLGYAQWRLYLNGRMPYEDAVAAIRRDTRAFIRRQYAWFNGHDTGIHWLDVTRTTPDDVLRRVHNWLSHREE
jgi:tRNA dimethylallyltransferase